jgi:hypothetical protein
VGTVLSPSGDEDGLHENHYGDKDGLHENHYGDQNRSRPSYLLPLLLRWQDVQSSMRLLNGLTRAEIHGTHPLAQKGTGDDVEL